MTPAWLTPPDGPAAKLVAAIAAPIPRLETARLVLRAPRLTDWPVLEPIWVTERAAHIGGPMSAEDAFLDFNQCVASWLLRGTGALTLTLKDDDTPLGLVVIGAEVGDPMLELGWLLTEAAEGHGYATEAAEALRDWAFTELGLSELASFVSLSNTRSARVAERLGAARTGTVPGHPDTAFFRHSKGRPQ